MERTFALLAQATADRGSNFRTFALATVEGGSPSVRMVVLRAVDRDARVLEFWTDRRSAKVEALPFGIEALFWDPKTAIQLRLTARTEATGTEDPVVASLFDGLPDHALLDYGSGSAPGTKIDHAPAFDRARARQNFLRVRLHATGADLLELRRGTNRRFRVEFDGGMERITPLTP